MQPTSSTTAALTQLEEKKERFMPVFPNQRVFDTLVLPAGVGQQNHYDEDTKGVELLTYLFDGVGDRAAAIRTPDDLIAAMDASGITKSVLSIQAEQDEEWVADAASRFPDRIVPALRVDPRKGMAEIRRIDRCANELGVRVLRAGPWMIEKPPTDRVYWPVYTKAIELGLPIEISVGIPGPQKPGWTQDPIYVDEVCYEFPELTVLMTHVGYPWVGTVIRNLLKWENCYMAMCAYAPRYWPEELVDHLRTRGRNKIMYGTEYPVMTWDRSLQEIEQLKLDDDVLHAFLYGNAARVLGEKDN
jgi:predicted TIM-barrel fold metal-dependent hydrolase